MIYRYFKYKIKNEMYSILPVWVLIKDLPKTNSIMRMTVTAWHQASVYGTVFLEQLQHIK